MAHGYDKMVTQAFDILSMRAGEARARYLMQTKLDQARRGFIGKSTGDAQKLGKKVIEANAVQVRQLLKNLDSILSVGGDDVPADAVDTLNARFTAALARLGELTGAAVKEYLDHDGGMERMVMARISAKWGDARTELDYEFGLMARKHQQKRAAPKRTRRRGLNSHVQPIHFEDFSGHQFERLVFAYCLLEEGAEVEWVGEVGGDDGCDIRSTASDGKVTIVLCANHQRLKFAKASRDLAKVAALDEKPDTIHVIAGSAVSADLKKKIKVEAKRLGFPQCKCWSGNELEEHIRRDGPHLLERLVYGEEFPASAEGLKEVALVKAIAVSVEAPADDFDPANLSDDAKRLLFEMSKDPEGNLLRTRCHDGYCLTINHHEFVPDTKERRIVAKWERVIKDLLELGYIECEESGDSLLAVTDEGYDALDNCGLIP